ncbi:RNA polymerase-associated protein RTF1-like protein [Pyrus ussuriensis x Pyrus communis]|uniref:RNA polymerase-associated protein RTF1-like protein n=1 Tax=Pyrus ussuriensis x Pyrus communis TaxID=2448454 RepID=A0A5N5IC76_9ROSA|nr:RNA polymerase-associated protein RTF1-like protein [Pyrus ussuriensis x Pyrus communis]
MPNKNSRILPDDKSVRTILAKGVGEGLKLEFTDAGVSQDDVAVRLSVNDHDFFMCFPSRWVCSAAAVFDLKWCIKEEVEGSSPELPISMVALQKFGGPQGAQKGFLAKKQRIEATIGCQVPENDRRRHALTLTVSDYKEKKKASLKWQWSSQENNQRGKTDIIVINKQH